MDNWIGIKEKATGRIKPLLAYRPGQSVTITLIHAKKLPEQTPLQIDFYYSPPQTARNNRVQAQTSPQALARALLIGSIRVDRDSLFADAGTPGKEEQLELSLSVDKAHHLHAVLKRAHAPAPVFPFIISQAQMQKCKLQRKNEATHRPPLIDLENSKLADTDKNIKLALRRANTRRKSRSSLKKPLIFLLSAVFSLLLILLVLTLVFPELELPFVGELLKSVVNMIMGAL